METLMRALRKHGVSEQPEAGEEPRPWRLLSRDLRPVEDERDEDAARERLRDLAAVPGFLLAVHLVCFGAVLAVVAAGSPAGLAAAAFAAILLADLGLWAAARSGELARLAPHAAVRLAGIYVVAAGLLSCLPLVTSDVAIREIPLFQAALLGAVVAIPAALLSFPVLVALGGAACVAATLAMWRDPAAAAAASLLAACLTRFSLGRAADRLAQLRRRGRLDRNAERAARFIAEFEQAGRGWFWETDSSGALSYVSEQLTADLRLPADELIGQPFTAILGPDDTAGAASSERTLGFHLSTRLPFADLTVRAAASAETWWSLSGTPSFNEFGRFLGFRGFGTDLTEQRRSEAEINRLAKYDALTGLPNRVLMRRTLDEALQAKSGSVRCALFLIDLDRFKNVNDTLGHPVGDALLKQVAQRLTQVVGSQGQVGRLGGDEFEAVLPDQDDASLGSLAGQLIQQISLPYTIEGHSISIGASVGIAIAPADGRDADELIRNAVLALYSAKAAGRGTFCFFAPEMHSEAQDRQMLENDLRKAIARGELELYFQPVVDTRTEALTGFEALVRWHHPVRGTILPSVFVPLAEESGLVLQIGEWVLRNACAQAARWPETVQVAVNLSPVQFTDGRLPNILVGALAGAQLPPRRLELEITEGAFLVESAKTEEMFARLKAIGVCLALDDFGTGYSSLGYLKKMPFDRIKIDQSFVRGAAKKGSRNAAIIRAIVGLAKSLGMHTTAEGAETHDELELIRELGCSHIQGYIFGRPVSGDEAARLAAEDRAVAAEGFEFNRPPRQGLLKVATVQWNGMRIAVRVRNISTGGALLEADRTLPLEAEVQLDLPGCGQLGAKVRWSEARRIGIQFDEEFDLRRLAPAKGKDARAGPVNQRYVPLKYSEEAVDKKPLRASDLR